MRASMVDRIKSWFIGMSCGVLLIGSMGAADISAVPAHAHVNEMPYIEAQETPVMVTPTPTPEPTPTVTPTPEPTPIDASISEQGVVLTDEEFKMVCLIAYAEAGNQDSYGIRLVIDTILNRVDHWAFPDSVFGVIYQKNQFSTVTDGALERAYVRDDIAELVREECMQRTNCDVTFFRTMRYSDYGVPLFIHGAHYFSSYGY